MLNMKTLDEMGTEVPLDDENGSYEPYEKLETALHKSPRAVEISAVRQREYGMLLTVDDEMRRNHPVVGDAHAVLWHSDNHPLDSMFGMRLVDEDTAAELVGNSTGAVDAEVIEHYKKSPVDDGNPGYKLYRMWLGNHADGNPKTAPTAS